MRKIRKAKKYIYKIVTALLCLLVCIEFVLPSAAILVRAEEDAESYDDTKIEDDLEGFDLTIYPANPLGECDIVAFMEYCYSENAKYSGVYGLYVYVYNPTKKSIVEADGYNFVNISTAFEGSKVTKYEKVNLEYLDKTSDNLFYKFKLSRSGELLAIEKAYAAENDGKRRYEIIELQIRHGAVDDTVEIAKAYEWSGYAVGCSPDESPISTLKCNNKGVRSIYLELMQTNYRFDAKPLEEEQDEVLVLTSLVCDELNSVFFTVPEEYFREFGDLYSIDAEWYEYKTKPMFVTSDSGAYRGLWDLRNVRINERGFPVDENGKVINTIPLSFWRVLWQPSLLLTGDEEGKYAFAYSFNPKCIDDIESLRVNEVGSLITLGGYDKNGDGKYEADHWFYYDVLNWLFYVDDITGSDGYEVSVSEVRDYMEKYTNDFYSEWKVEERYASSLFEMIVDEDRMSCLWQNRLKDGNGGYLRDEEGNIKTANQVSCGLVKMDFTA